MSTTPVTINLCLMDVVHKLYICVFGSTLLAHVPSWFLILNEMVSNYFVIHTSGLYKHVLNKAGLGVGALKF